MKKIIVIAFFLIAYTSHAQTEGNKLYHPDADAAKDIAAVVKKAKGERIHTQNSEYLEDGKKSYDQRKVQEFLEKWSPRALNPEMYSK